MKILHTSDWHLGAMDGDRSLIEDQRFFIDEICRIVKDHAIDAVIIAGDVYDRSVSSAEAIKLYDYAMTRLCKELNNTVIIIAGNHDSAERLASCSDLLSSAGLYISGSLGGGCSAISLNGVDIYLLPWITEAKVKSIYPDQEENISSLEDAYRVVTAEIRKSFDKDKKHILAAHAFITNSETSTSDRAAEIGLATQVSAGVFEGFDYVALGHLHGPQNVTENIRYSGTPMPYSFGKEEKQEKSVTIIDTDHMSQTIVKLPLLHKRTTITGSLDEVLTTQWPEEIKNGYVRVRINDQYIGLEALSELKRIFPDLLDASGKTYDGENSSVTLTIDELEKLETDPVEVFKFFCREMADTEPDDRLIGRFINAIEMAEEVGI